MFWPKKCKNILDSTFMVIDLRSAEENCVSEFISQEYVRLGFFENFPYSNTFSVGRKMLLLVVGKKYHLNKYQK